ncbi:molybdenum cofactor guanylyltransferase [Lysobacter brunescens]|uniref:Molybdenum cofactor guanylyltransferase n=1 Tax=Lysobacter brunescens TaxID=262323 RepID=A0ABW2YEQ2_9GAMM
MRLPSPHELTLGLIAGGRASRLGGVDKAWLMRGGVSQVLRWTRRFPGEHGPVLVSANRDPDRYAAHGLFVVGDRHPDLGPIGGLDALSQACATPWLLTLPVDLVGVNDCLVRTLVSKRDADGAFARDDDGVQPLVALWRAEALRIACAEAISRGEIAIHRLQATLRMAEVAFTGFRFGNLNTPDDLRAAGIDPEPTA